MKATLPIPQELTALIEAGFWPKDSNAAMGQNLRSLVPESVVRALLMSVGPPLACQAGSAPTLPGFITGTIARDEGD